MPFHALLSQSKEREREREEEREGANIKVKLERDIMSNTKKEVAEKD